MRTLSPDRISASVADKWSWTNFIDASLSSGKSVKGIIREVGRFSNNKHRNAVR